MRTLILPLMLMLGVTTSLRAQMSVTIADFPESALMYTPVYVTVLIKNETQNTMLVPVNEDSHRGISLEVSSGNEYLPVSGEAVFKLGDSVRWLKPNEEYFTQYEISESLPRQGVYEIRATYRSDGKCQISPTTAKRLNIAQLSSKEKDKGYTCSVGSTSSPIQKIMIFGALNGEDIQLLNEVISGKWHTSLRNSETADVRRRLIDAYPNLIEKYPNSPYTYAAGLYSAGSSMWGYPYWTLEKIMSLQPNHPLARYAQMMWWLSILRNAGDLKYGQEAKERLMTKGKPILSKTLEKYTVQIEKDLVNQPH